MLNAALKINEKSTGVKPVPLQKIDEEVFLTSEGIFWLRKLQEGDNLEYLQNQCAETICFVASVFNHLNPEEKETANLLMTDLSRLRNNLKKLKKPAE